MTQNNVRHFDVLLQKMVAVVDKSYSV
jgi:hypothetical protein